MMRRTGYADSCIGHNIDIFLRALVKTVSWINAQIHLVMTASDAKGLGEFARP